MSEGILSITIKPRKGFKQVAVLLFLTGLMKTRFSGWILDKFLVVE